MKKSVPSRKQIYAMLMSYADMFERTALALEAKGTGYDKDFADAARRVAAKYAARAHRMHSGPDSDED